MSFLEKNIFWLVKRLSFISGIFHFNEPQRLLRSFSCGLVIVFLFATEGYSQVPIPGHAGSIVNGAGGAMLNAPQSVFTSGNYAYLVSTNAL